jgi:ribonuclease HI
VELEPNAPEAPRVIVATDGACRGGSGPGGWSAVIVEDGSTRTLCGGSPDTTGGRMELLAAIEGLAALDVPSRVTLHANSRYLMDGITRWMPGWIERGWRNADGRPVRNRDLWERLIGEAARHEISWTRCDERPVRFCNAMADGTAGPAVPDGAIRMKTERSCA